MEAFWKFLGLSVALALIALTLRSLNKPLGTAFSLIAGAALLTALVDPMRQAVEVLQNLAASAQMEAGQTALVLKLLGVGFAAEFAAQACRDAGENGLAMRVELGGKVLLLLTAAPLLQEMADLILAFTA